ncbi:MAG: cell division protein FtsA [Lachnospiraceae bacterium]|nr:cell division protein FtsA [Lachnospiraceae bacterium]
MSKNDSLVFGLDIGTRSIVGTVGQMKGDKFTVLCERSMEHETRAMLDGQIHDIGRVANTIRIVKGQCEEAIGKPLKQVCIAAAGRVLRTVDTHVDMVFEEEREVNEEDVSNLCSLGIEKAYKEFLSTEKSDVKFYCVGYSVIKYCLNSYPISNLVGHKARQISADLIATFLPDDVVDGLYKAVELADLEVANLTLEPIAAISVAIPERFRMLNIALVDVGAGTSDISITKDGSIIAYGMIPMAGDAYTEEIAKACLVDFAMAEKIKREALDGDTIKYEDIMGLTQKISADEVNKIINPLVEEMTDKVSAEIKRLNGDKSVSAVFIVGGGGMVRDFAPLLADKLQIARERVALRGGEVMGNIDFLEKGAEKTSLMVTPIGICLNYYEHSNNLIYVSFNGQRIKLYDNGHVTVSDVAMQAEFPNDGLFPKRGKALTYTVNGKSKISKGEIGETAIITINGEPADIGRLVECNDKIVIKESTAGVRARVRISNLPEYKKDIRIIFDGRKVNVLRPVLANGKRVLPDYDIMDEDHIEISEFCRVSDVIESLDLDKDSRLLVNNAPANDKTEIYENFSVSFASPEDISFADAEAEEDETEASEEVTDESSESVENAESSDTVGTNDASDSTDSSSDATGTSEVKAETAAESNAETVAERRGNGLVHNMTVLVNGKPVTLTGKSDYVFVDVFDYIDFDLSKPEGKSVVTNHNGKPAQYMNSLSSGDNLEIYWKD